MLEYIDRDHYCKYLCRCNGDKCEKTKCSIFTAPTADVVEVVHGKWIHNPKREYDYICSVCRGDAPENRMRNNAILTPYCPHCGAKMDGGKENG